LQKLIVNSLEQIVQCPVTLGIAEGGEKPILGVWQRAAENTTVGSITAVKAIRWSTGMALGR